MKTRTQQRSAALTFLVVVAWPCVAAGSIEDLFAAAATGDVAKIEQLLRPGQSYAPNTLDRGGRTPLFVAALNGHEHAVRALVDGGANVNYATRDGDTPLMVAAFRGHYEIVKYLLQKRADPSRVNNDGLTARDVAKARGHGHIAELLATRVSPTESPVASTRREQAALPADKVQSPEEQRLKAISFLTTGDWCRTDTQGVQVRVSLLTTGRMIGEYVVPTTGFRRSIPGQWRMDDVSGTVIRVTMVGDQFEVRPRGDQGMETSTLSGPHRGESWAWRRC